MERWTKRKYLYYNFSPATVIWVILPCASRHILGKSYVQCLAMPVCVLLQSCLTLCHPMDCIACQAPMFMGFFRQEYWRGLPYPPPGDFPNPGIGPSSLVFPAWASGVFTIMSWINLTIFFAKSHIHIFSPTLSLWDVVSLLRRKKNRGFPGGSVVKNLPVNVGDRGFALWSIKIPHASEQLLGLSFKARELQLLKPEHPRTRAPQQEKPAQWEAGES